MNQTRKYRKNANLSHLITVRDISDTEYFWEGDFLRVYSTLSHHMVEHLFIFFVLIYLSDTVYFLKILPKKYYNYKCLLQWLWLNAILCINYARFQFHFPVSVSLFSRSQTKVKSVRPRLWDQVEPGRLLFIINVYMRPGRKIAKYWLYKNVVKLTAVSVNYRS
jgi:hypothetical protein